VRFEEVARGLRCGAACPAVPAASRLPCGARVSRGLAELASLKQLRALIRETLRSSAAQRGTQRRSADRAPVVADAAVRSKQHRVQSTRRPPDSSKFERDHPFSRSM